MEEVCLKSFNAKPKNLFSRSALAARLENGKMINIADGKRRKFMKGLVT